VLESQWPHPGRRLLKTNTRQGHTRTFI